MAISHDEARRILREAAPDATDAELDAVQGVAWIETQYGQGWKSAGVGSHNWGAIVCTRESQNCFEHKDSNPEGSYIARFRIYESDLEGARDVAREVLRRMGVKEAAKAGSAYGVAEAMYHTGYYQGTSPDPETNISRYSKRLVEANILFGGSLGKAETVPTERPTEPEALAPWSARLSPLWQGPLVSWSWLVDIKRNAKGPSVALWQAIIGAHIDGWYGPVTLDMTRQWQAKRISPLTGQTLVADGIVGRNTWSASIVELETNHNLLMAALKA